MEEFINVTRTLIEDLKKDGYDPDKSVKPWVLVVEDNQFDQELMVSRLQRFGFQVEATITGEDALRFCDEKDYAAIFLDLNLGNGIGGLNVLEALRKKAKPPRVVIVTGAADQNFGPELARIGGYLEVVHKPLDRKAVEQIFKKEK